MTHYRREPADSQALNVNPLFARPGQEEVPRFTLPDGEMLPDDAYRIIHGEMLLNGNSRQNLATFVTTWMEEQAGKLYAEAISITEPSYRLNDRMLEHRVGGGARQQT